MASVVCVTGNLHVQSSYIWMTISEVFDRVAVGRFDRQENVSILLLHPQYA